MLMKDKNVAAIVLFNTSGEVLLQKKDMRYPWFPGKWCLFGGSIEDGESPLEAIQRELKEELGCDFENLQYLFTQVYQDTSGEKIRTGNHYIFKGTFKGAISQLHLSEGAGFAFFSPEELANVPIVDHDLRAIRTSLSGI